MHMHALCPSPGHLGHLGHLGGISGASRVLGGISRLGLRLPVCCTHVELTEFIYCVRVSDLSHPCISPMTTGVMYIACPTGVHVLPVCMSYLNRSHTHASHQ